MRMRPILLAATVAALALSTVPAQAGGKGGGSIAKLKALDTARAKIIKQQSAETAAAEADLKQELATENKAKKAAAKKARLAAQIPGTGPMRDRKIVAAIDTAYQGAVKANDFRVMDQILGDDVAVVLGDGRAVNRADLLNEAQSGVVSYEQQDEVPGTRSVRVWNDTAVVTALLWVKGQGLNGPFDDHVWFSSTYTRVGRGWRYVFGQVSTPLSADKVAALVEASAKAVPQDATTATTATTAQDGSSGPMTRRQARRRARAMAASSLQSTTTDQTDPSSTLSPDTSGTSTDTSGGTTDPSSPY